MSILKGAANAAYNLTFYDNSIMDANNFGSIISTPSYHTTDWITLQGDTLILNDHDLVVAIRYADVNQNYIGQALNSQDQAFTGDFPDFNSNTITVPSNAVYAYLWGYDVGGASTVQPQTTFSEFSQLTVSYDTNPAIDNIYYGGAIVENHLSFDGVNDYVDLGTLGNWFSQNGSNFAFEFDVENPNTDGNDTLFGYANTSNNNQIRIAFFSDELYVYIEGNGNVENITVSNFSQYYNQRFNLYIEYSNNEIKVEVDGVSLSTNILSNENPSSFSDFTFSPIIGSNNVNNSVNPNQHLDFNLYNFKIYNGSTLFLHYDISDGSGNTLTDVEGTNDGTINGATWGTPTVSYPTIDRVYAGESLLFGQPPFPLYELIADVEVTSNTTQIDFDNLNITKDDELRLVYTLIHDTGSAPRLQIFPNNFTNTTSYYTQSLLGRNSAISASRSNENIFSIFRDGNKVSGYADIKISNNDRFVAQSHTLWGIGSTASTDIRNWTFNIVGVFTINNITSLTLTSDISNAFVNGSRFTLYKVNKGVA